MVLHLISHWKTKTFFTYISEKKNEFCIYSPQIQVLLFLEWGRNLFSILVFWRVAISFLILFFLKKKKSVTQHFIFATKNSGCESTCYSWMSTQYSVFHAFISVHHTHKICVLTITGNPRTYSEQGQKAICSCGGSIKSFSSALHSSVSSQLSVCNIWHSA